MAVGAQRALLTPGSALHWPKPPPALVLEMRLCVQELVASASVTGVKGSSAWAGAEAAGAAEAWAEVLHHRDLSSHQRALP